MGVLVLALASCSAWAPAAPATPPWVKVGPNVQISRDNARLAHGEVLAAADPVNPKHLIACSGVWTSPERSAPNWGISDVAYVTFDGGASWKGTNVTRVGLYDLDPVCDIGPDGVAYFGGITAQPAPGHDWLMRSRDGGRHWMKPTLFPFGDREFVAIDKTDSPYRGRLYDTSLNSYYGVEGHVIRFGEVRSTNGGETFLPPVTIFGEPRANPIEYYSGPLAVLRNGDVVALGYEMPAGLKRKRIVAFLSTDGGQSFSKPHLVATRLGSPLAYARYKEEGQSISPIVASDDSNGPYSGRVYVAWQDFSKHLYGVFAPLDSQGSVMIAHSDDDGRSWSVPIEVDDAPAWPKHRYPEVFAPAIAVNDRGIVAVTWYDGRNLPDGSGGTLRMAVSSDGGTSFSPSFAVSSAPSLLSPDANHVTLVTAAGYGQTDVTHFVTDVRFHVYGQDTQGLAADAAGNFHPVWVDDRTGTAQLWTDTVSVDLHAIRHGDRRLSALADVSNSVDLDVSGETYTPRTKDVSATVALVNTSKHSIAAPILVRITSLTSQLGTAGIQGAHGRTEGAGTILAFVPSRGDAIAPSEKSKALRIVFHLSHTHRITPNDVVVDWIDYVTISYRAYATTRSTPRTKH